MVQLRLREWRVFVQHCTCFEALPVTQIQQYITWYLMSEWVLVCTKAKPVVALLSICGMLVLNTSSEGSGNMLVFQFRGT